MSSAPKQHLRMKYTLAAFAMREADDFMKLFSTNAQGLALFWENAAKSYAPEDRVSAKGAANGVIDIRGCEAVFLAMPPPTQRNEAYYMLVLRQPGGRCRVFALEGSLHPTTSEPLTVLAEFYANGRANWGDGPAPTPDAFIRSVLALMSDAEAKPKAFTELPIIQM